MNSNKPVKGRVGPPDKIYEYTYMFDRKVSKTMKVCCCCSKFYTDTYHYI